MMPIFLISLLFVGSVVMSFLLSGMEAGVLALSRLRIRQMLRAGNPNARALLDYLERPEDFLWTILVGNMLANFIAVGLMVVLLRRWLDPYPGFFLISFLALMFLFYALFELLPKMLFRMFPNRLTLAIARPFRLIHLVLSPLVKLITTVSQRFLKWTGGRAFMGHLFGSREEMRLVMQESAQGLTSEERQMINRVLDLQNRTVRDIAIPMDKVATLTMQTRMGDALKISQERRLSRFPVWRGEGNERKIVGLVSLRAVVYQAELDPEKTAGDYVRPALYMEENMRLEEALKRMQRSGQRLAIVLGHDQREAGIVTLQDILKVIFGEVRL
ncbi:MAG TPA: CNNM domain-containing protein [Verrucomicrobiae bacterium]|nr:CNNM domain-containing protein [Verrucomicrobiae bacterium]